MKIAQTSAHFIGVGGVGMSALAQLFKNMGASVSGSDVKEGKLIQDLKTHGIEIFLGHNASNISKDLNVVVYSSAIDKKNPEIVEARRLGIPIIQRAEALAEIMRFKRGIAVGGTHGKTTTTSLISAIFMHSKMDPTIAVGGRLKLIESTARLGQGPWMVAEADESDGSFSRLSPEIAIITNIDSDHLDHFGHFENLQNAFLNFALNIPYYGSVVIFGDDPRTRLLFKDFTKKIFYYGEGPDNDFILKQQGDGRYSVFYQGNTIGEFKLQVPGFHNALNAMAAIIATHQAGVSWDLCFKGVSEFSGVDRRFQKIAEIDGIEIVDDYAHHPTEISATLQAAREYKPQGKIYLHYQPHRYTRTRDCWQQYMSCFEIADELFIYDIYPAGEEPIEGVTSQDLSLAMPQKSNYVAGQKPDFNKLMPEVKKGDLVLTMGAGNIWQVGLDFVQQLKQKNQKKA